MVVGRTRRVSGLNPLPRLARDRDYHPWRLGLAILCISLLVFSVSCPEMTSQPPAEGTVGIAGGEVEGPEGSKVVVPTGALEEETTLTVEEKESPTILGAKVVGKTLEVGPAGTVFKTPITIEIPFAESDLPSGTTTADLQIQTADTADGKWTILPTVYENGALKAQVSHLSLFSVVIAAPDYQYTVDLVVDRDKIGWTSGEARFRLRVRDLVQAFGGGTSGRISPDKVFGKNAFPDWDTMHVEEIADDGEKTSGAKLSLERSAKNYYHPIAHWQVWEIAAGRGNQPWPGDVTEDKDKAKDGLPISLTKMNPPVLTMTPARPPNTGAGNKYLHGNASLADAIYEEGKPEGKGFTIELGDSVFTQKGTNCTYQYTLVTPDTNGADPNYALANTEYALTFHSLGSVKVSTTTSSPAPTKESVVKQLVDAVNKAFEENGEAKAKHSFTTATDKNGVVTKTHYLTFDYFVERTAFAPVFDAKLFKKGWYSGCATYALCRTEYLNHVYVSASVNNGSFDKDGDSGKFVPYIFEAKASASFLNGKMGGAELGLRRDQYTKCGASSAFWEEFGHIYTEDMQKYQAVFWVTEPEASGCDRLAQLKFTVQPNTKATINGVRLHRFEPYVRISKAPTAKIARYRISFNAADAKNNFLSLAAASEENGKDYTDKIGNGVSYADARWLTQQSYRLQLDKSNPALEQVDLAFYNSRQVAAKTSILPQQIRDKVRLTLARHEAEPIELVLRPKSDLTLKSVSVDTMLTNASGNKLQLSVKKYVRVNADFFKPDQAMLDANAKLPKNDPKRTPDLGAGANNAYLPLSLHAGHKFPAGENTALRLVLRAPENASPSICSGNYGGKITITLTDADDKDLTFEIPYDVHLLELALPRKPAFEALVQSDRNRLNELGQMHGYPGATRDAGFLTMLIDGYADHRYSGTYDGVGVLNQVGKTYAPLPTCLYQDESGEFFTYTGFSKFGWKQALEPLFKTYMGPTQSLTSDGLWQTSEGDAHKGRMYSYALWHNTGAVGEQSPTGTPYCPATRVSNGKTYTCYQKPYGSAADDYAAWAKGMDTFHSMVAATLKS
jgi:hypothetical protein